jgi:hypothetical protein
MEIRVSSIGDKGDLSNERIGFNILKSCQLKYYLLVKTSKTKNGFANIGNAFYWFLPKKVNEKDKVVIYTKAGESSVKENNDGTKTYFFFWGLDSPIFKSDSDKVVLVKADDWKMK